MEAGILLACLLVGTATELVSRGLGLWVYREPWLRAFSVVVVFGVTFGALSILVAPWPLPARFAAGALLGTAYEAANLLWLGLFHFQPPLSRLPRRLLIPVAGAPWGLLPAIAPPLGRMAGS